ncbi:hypothetical protein [Thermoplasma sp. Kam2015]|uniref:hypothetical protein n=1 Tax=Thermoplasma sp. Kam2015 TaxID=2094122 RepID=UPI0012933C6D|nr:hypothetical protein [Thermoplasma sp. Kam2015]
MDVIVVSHRIRVYELVEYLYKGLMRSPNIKLRLWDSLTWLSIDMPVRSSLSMAYSTMSDACSSRFNLFEYSSTRVIDDTFPQGALRSFLIILFIIG